ncbi:MAG: mannose-1-phosphate guanylyltransferase [Treponema sp.]|nr:mannose-1-phosphate guanylyltransferase [Treponema sp.]
MFTDCIIMAGGSGTRLWPASNSRCPKQFLEIPGGGTFFKSALERAFAVTEADGLVIIVTGMGHVPHVVKACAELPELQRKRIVVIPEPVGKNTAPAIACAATFIKKQAKHNKRSALVLTSDHIIGPLQDFAADAAAAAQLAVSDALVVFGIPPQRPETGFGYIEAGPPVSILDDRVGPGTRAALDAQAYKVTRFREKPDLATAQSFLAKGNFFWNSGMFAFNVDFMLSQFREHAPETIAPFEALPQPLPEHRETQQGVALLSRWPGLKEAYTAVAPISIDYAIAEKCPSVAMVASRFSWTDVGSWDEYAKILEQGKATANSASQSVFSAGSSNCFVDSDIPVALCGVEDLIVVVRSGADGKTPSVLICKKGESQQVKTIVEQIKKADRGDLL